MGDDNKITLKVATPAGFFEGTFDANTKVADVISIIVRSMKLAGGDEFELDFDGKKLSPGDLIGSIDFGSNPELDLIATGSAV